MLAKLKNGLPSDPELTIEQVWARLTAAPDNKTGDTHQRVHQYLVSFDAQSQEGILADLLKIERDSLKQNNRLRGVRQAIMDLVDRKLSAFYLNGVQQSVRTAATQSDDDDQSRRLGLALADSEIQIAALRAYALGKYGDGSKNDWFAAYEALSDFFHRRMFEAQTDTGPAEFAFDGERFKASRDKFQLCKEKCLDAYIGQKFEISNVGTNWFKIILRNLKRKVTQTKLIN